VKSHRLRIVYLMPSYFTVCCKLEFKSSVSHEIMFELNLSEVF
jgi:hypothetical protein